MERKRAVAGKSGKRRQSSTRSRKEKFNPDRESVKLLLFTQAVLYFGAGALPGMYRLVALLPAAILAGVGAFRALSATLAYLEARKRTKVAKPTPEVRPQPSRVPAKEPVLVASRVA